MMILPPQLISDEERYKKTENRKSNIEETIDYYISQCNWVSYNDEIQKLYNAVEGILDTDEYKYIQNPFNMEAANGELPTYAAKLKNFNIIKGIVNLLMGEFARRSHDYVVTDFNPSDEISYKDALGKVLKNYYTQKLINTLQTSYPDIGEVQELPPLEEYVKDFKDKFDNNRVIRGQDALDYIKYEAKLDNKYIDLYYDWIVTGGAFTFKTINNNNVVFERVPSNELFVPFNKSSRFVEDAPYAIRRQLVPVSYILDFFKGDIDKETLEAIDNHINNGIENISSSFHIGKTGFNFNKTLTNNTHITGNNLTFDKLEGIELFHFQFKTYKEYKILKYVNELGVELEMEVDTSYTLQPELGDISLNVSYKNIIIEGYKVLEFYLKIKEIDFDRADFNGGNQKLSYNGIRERSYSGELQSIVKDGIPYQAVINVLGFQLEKLINKNKDKLLVLPRGLINGKNGIKAKTAMYHADATSILWVDETSPNAQIAAQMLKSVDMSLNNYISNTKALMKDYKYDYWEQIGINAQRYADVGTSAGKAVTEQAIVRSAIITNELVRQFEMLIESDYAGLLDISKFAWINGKKGNYILSDGSVAFLNLNADDAIYHTESEYGIFVKDSSLNTEAINSIKQQALPLIQNGAPAHTLTALHSTNNLEKLSRILEKLEDNKREYEQATQKQAEEAQQKLQETINSNSEKERELEYYKIDKGYEATVDSATIRSSNNSRNEPRPANDVERVLASHKIQNDNAKLALQDKKINNNK